MHEWKRGIVDESAPLLRSKAREILESQQTRSAKFFDFLVMVAIGLAAIVFILETIPSIAKSASYWLTLTLNILYCFFLLEYTARIWVTRQRLSFIFSFWGLVDLIAILPLILSIFGVSLDLVMVRMLRLLRLFSLLKKI